MGSPQGSGLLMQRFDLVGENFYLIRILCGAFARNCAA
jgi:hypothetical protein